MIAIIGNAAWRWVQQALARPLTLGEGIASLAVLMLLGTVYCQIYCLLALQQMHGSSMPILASVARSSADIVPAFLTFEAGKRVMRLERLARVIALAALFAAGLALGLLLRMQVHAMSQTLTVRHMAVDRLPFLFLAAAGLVFYALRQKRAGSEKVWTEADQRDQLPPANAIEWVKAAGNYVEVRAAGRTRLLRMTLRQLRAGLPPENFIQIHRSVIVNRDRIARMKGRSLVEMADGTSFNVGDAHRSNLRAW